jgi:excinuclease ABC subunit C
VRDEAHRFAITYHRQKRSRTMAQSVLDGVPGLGELRRKAILRAFGSVKRLRAASIDEIAEVPGVGRRTAEAIHAALAETTPTSAVDPATGEILDDKMGELRTDTNPLRVGGFEASP